MRDQALRERSGLDGFDEHPSVVDIVIAKACQRQCRRTDVGVIGPGLRVDALALDTRTHEAAPIVGDFRLDVTVTPARVVVDARVASAGGAILPSEVVGIT